MYLSRDVLKGLIETQQLVQNYEDIDKQVTANGVDMRLAAIIEVSDGGKLAIEKVNNRPPKFGKAIVLPGFEKRLEGYQVEELVVGTGTIKLHKLKTYLAVTCEEVNTPKNLMFTILPRSSLFRLTQSLLGTGFGEAGYRGCMTYMLLPFADSEIELGARFAQIAFSELKGEADYEQQKESTYQGGRIV